MNLSELGRTGIELLIDEWIVGRNADRDRNIMKERLIRGSTYEAIAETFDLSVTHVKRIVYKWTEALSKHMQS